MNSSPVFMLRLALFALLLVSPAVAQSLSWKAPETAQVGKSYTVSVSCVEAASMVLLKDGVVVAVGAATATVTTADPLEQTVTFTAHAFPGNESASAMTSSWTVTITIDAPVAVSAVPAVGDPSAFAIVPAADPVRTAAP